jgi:hypothetical protein
MGGVGSSSLQEMVKIKLKNMIKIGSNFKAFILKQLVDLNFPNSPKKENTPKGVFVKNKTL